MSEKSNRFYNKKKKKSSEDKLDSSYSASKDQAKSNAKISMRALLATLFWILVISTSLLVLTVSIFVGYLYNQTKANLEPIKYDDVLVDALSYKWYDLREFFSEETIKYFRNLVTNGEYLSTITDEKHVESAGEAVPIGIWYFFISR
jgi:hypothetical protein